MLAVTLAVLHAVGMGLSRVYLGQPWLTDVLVAWCMAGSGWPSSSGPTSSCSTSGSAAPDLQAGRQAPAGESGSAVPIAGSSADVGHCRPIPRP
jgi:hypothetical protein